MYLLYILVSTDTFMKKNKETKVLTVLIIYTVGTST